MDFPIFKTKKPGLSKKFNLNISSERKEYFEAKAGVEIQKLKNYLKKDSFICYLLGKKNSGKGTYAKMFAEAVGPDKVTHLSIGDIVRDVHQIFLENTENKQEITEFLNKNFRGYISLKSAIEKLLSRDTTTLLPTEFILSLVEWKISQLGRQTLFIDGFPRDMDQISYALFFRNLIGQREDADIFVLINVPMEIIDMRMKYRVICPKCHTPRNTRLSRTEKIGYDKSKEFYLICDNPKCEEAKMIQKEGDDLGIETIKERLEKDDKLIKMAFSLYGVPKVFLRNSIPIDKALDYVDDYEITPAYEYKWIEAENRVEVIEKPLKAKDDKGIFSYSLLPEPVVVSLIHQIAGALNL